MVFSINVFKNKKKRWKNKKNVKNVKKHALKKKFKKTFFTSMSCSALLLDVIQTSGVDMWQNRGMPGQAIKLFMITPHVNDQIKSNSSLLNTDKRSVLQTV